MRIRTFQCLECGIFALEMVGMSSVFNRERDGIKLGDRGSHEKHAAYTDLRT